MKTRYLLLLLVLLTGLRAVVSPTAFAQRAWYVNNSSIGNDERDGSSPVIPVPDDGITGPKRTLSRNSSGAIDASSTGDTIFIIDTYTPYDTTTGEKPKIVITQNLIFRSNDGAITIGSEIQVNNSSAPPNNTVIFDTGNFTLLGGLTLTAGVITLKDTLTVAGSSIITVDAGSITKIGTGAIIYGNGISVQYVPSAADYVSSGTELPPIVKNLRFTRLSNAINRTTTLSTPITITDTLSIANDFKISDSALITLNGDLIVATDTFTNATIPVTTFNVPLMMAGSENASITVTYSAPVTGMPLSSLTIAKADSTAAVTLSGGNLDLSAGVITFTKGIFKTGTNVLYISAPTAAALAGGARSQGFIGGSPRSHVLGNVAKKLVNDGSLANSTEAVNEFPVGNGVDYRSAILTFNPVNGIPTTPNATIVVSHLNSNPGGIMGLPIIDGIESGINISRYSSFYWRIYTIGNVSASKIFDLSLTGGNYKGFDSPVNVRIIRRYGAAGDVNNDWLLQGQNTDYDNEINSSTGFVAISRNSVGGLRTGGSLFTYGMQTRFIPDNCRMPDFVFIRINNVYVPNPYKIPLAGKFSNYTGTLTYLASSINPLVAAAVIVDDTLMVTVLNEGDAVITVKATDANNDFATCSFRIESSDTCCDDFVKTGTEYPKEFELSQNYPNPSNPVTSIMFSVPQRSSVRIAVYDMLGREILSLVNTDFSPGNYLVPFNAGSLASGMYTYRMIARPLSDKQKIFTSTKKLLLIK